jgi:hypothetical protein
MAVSRSRTVRRGSTDQRGGTDQCGGRFLSMLITRFGVTGPLSRMPAST